MRTAQEIFGKVFVRCVLIRVKRAWIETEGEEIASIGKGVQLLVAFHKGERKETIRSMARKVAHLRLFSHQEKSFHLSLLECHLPCLVVPNFTLGASTRKGRRPEFSPSAGFEEAKNCFAFFVESLKAEGLQVKQGAFGKEMEVGSVNDGPVTFVLEK